MQIPGYGDKWIARKQTVLWLAHGLGTDRQSCSYDTVSQP